MTAEFNDATIPYMIQSEAPYKKMYAYGTKHALMFSQSVSRSGIHTINVEGAQAVTASNNRKSYNWENKLAFQLTMDELPLCTAVWLNILPEFSAKFHGDPAQQAQKSLLIQKQKGHFYGLISSSVGQSHAVPIPLERAYYIATMFLHQLHMNSPNFNITDIIVLLKTIYSPLRNE